jgi:hypothetical protein
MSSTTTADQIRGVSALPIVYETNHYAFTLAKMRLRTGIPTTWTFIESTPLNQPSMFWQMMEKQMRERGEKGQEGNP